MGSGGHSWTQAKQMKTLVILYQVEGISPDGCHLGTPREPHSLLTYPGLLLRVQWTQHSALISTLWTPLFNTMA